MPQKDLKIRQKLGDSTTKNILQTRSWTNIFLLTLNAQSAPSSTWSIPLSVVDVKILKTRSDRRAG